MPDKQQILKGRKAVDAYRTAHTKLYEKGWHKGIPEDHTPLLNIMLGAFKEQGFNSIKEFFDASKELNYADDGVYEHNIYKFRKDLEMLGEPASNNGVELRQIEAGRELLIDGWSVMDTSVFEHITMKHSAGRCPTNARVFIGGLGLGLIFLYLAELGRAVEIVVYEIDGRVINLLKPRIDNYLALKYPNFNLQIIQGDALEKILSGGKYDWIFLDLPEPTPIKAVEVALTDIGIYTDWWSVSTGLKKEWWR